MQTQLQPSTVTPSKVHVPLSERINLRLLVFLLVIGGVVGYPIYLFVDEAVSGGIHNYGDYKAVNLQAMSTFNFDQTNGTAAEIPQKWRALDGQKVVVEGEMWNNGSAADELHKFDLVYSKNKCCFTGPPLVQHFVKSTVVGRGLVPYYVDRVRVTGVLHVDVQKTEAGAVGSVYTLDVQKVEPL